MNERDTGEDTAQLAQGDQAATDWSRRGGGVYTMTNGAGGNMVEAFSRDPSGILTALGSFATGGFGSGAGLGSQGSVRLNTDSRQLLVVNAASDQATAFQVGRDGSLRVLNTVGTGGRFPISVTATDHIAYVLDAGSTPLIAGFFLGDKGLSPLLESRRRLSRNSVGPAEVRFSKHGKRLDVTEKFSNSIDIFPLDHRLMPGAPMSSPSAGVEPFGSVWPSYDRLLVSEATSNTVTLYAVGDDNRLTVVAGPVPDFQIAPCWVALTGDGAYAYVANTGSGTLSSYRVGRNSLSLLASVAAIIGGAPIDLALSRDSRFLYALNGQTISGFAVQGDGSLLPLRVVPVTPGSVGIAAF